MMTLLTQVSQICPFLQAFCPIHFLFLAHKFIQSYFVTMPTKKTKAVAQNKKTPATPPEKAKGSVYEPSSPASTASSTSTAVCLFFKFVLYYMSFKHIQISSVPHFCIFHSFQLLSLPSPQHIVLLGETMNQK